jgi:hypothetical protein
MSRGYKGMGEVGNAGRNLLEWSSPLKQPILSGRVGNKPYCEVLTMFVCLSGVVDELAELMIN